MPWRMIVGSTTPVSSTRRRTISRLCSNAARVHAATAASEGFTWIFPEEAVTCMSGPPAPGVTPDMAQ